MLTKDQWLEFLKNSKDYKESITCEEKIQIGDYESINPSITISAVFAPSRHVNDDILYDDFLKFRMSLKAVAKELFIVKVLTQLSNSLARRQDVSFQSDLTIIKDLIKHFTKLSDC